MGRLICWLLWAACAACGRHPPATVVANPDGHGPQVVVWGPPGSNASDGGGGM